MSQPDEGENSATDEEYTVEAILGWRYSQEHKCKEYRVKWLGYSLGESTWEPEANLNCPDLIEVFERCLDDADRKCYNSTNPFNLNGFQRHANLRHIITIQMIENDHYFVCQFDDSQNLEQIQFDQVFKSSPNKALQFLANHNIKNHNVADSH